MFRVKICGVTSREDAQLCVAAGADAVGLNFHRPSPRYVEPTIARQIAAALPASVSRVGVFVNATVADVTSICEQVGLDWAQLHGDEPAETVRELGGQAVVKAFRCREGGEVSVRDFVHRCDALHVRPAAILIDAYLPGSYGGTGQTVDWELVRRLRQQVAPTPVVLAGGLRADNVARAIHATRAHAVDTASGVESAPGRKDPGLVRAFVAQALAAFESRE